MEKEKKELVVKYDEQSDKLDVHVGDDSHTVKLMIQKDLYIELDEQSGEMVGYTIFDYSANSHKNKGWAQMLREVPEQLKAVTHKKAS